MTNPIILRIRVVSLEKAVGGGGGEARGIGSDRTSFALIDRDDMFVLVLFLGSSEKKTLIDCAVAGNRFPRVGGMAKYFHLT
jgi:hypothetical protein